MTNTFIFLILKANCDIINDNETVLVNGKWYDSAVTGFYEPSSDIHSLTKCNYMRFDDQYCWLYEWNDNIQSYSCLDD